MKYKIMYYRIFSGPDIHFKKLNIKKARQVVRGLVNSRKYVICDRIIKTNSNEHNERLFRNNPEFPLNKLKA